MGYGYTQIRSLTGLAHGQIYIESETHSYFNQVEIYSLLIQLDKST